MRTVPKQDTRPNGCRKIDEGPEFVVAPCGLAMGLAVILVHALKVAHVRFFLSKSLRHAHPLNALIQMGVNSRLHQPHMLPGASNFNAQFRREKKHDRYGDHDG